MLNRKAVTLNTLAFTACVLLMIQPMSLFDVGFQLSYVSVASILIFYQPLYSIFCNTSTQNQTGAVRFGRALWGTLAVSLAAQIGVAPLIAHYFGRFPVYFLFTNLAVVMLAPLIIYGALFFWAFAWQPSLQAIFAKFISLLTDGLNGILHFIASLPCASIEPITLNTIGVIACYVIILSAYLIYLILRPSKR
jgi:competence protein ComEC